MADAELTLIDPDLQAAYRNLVLASAGFDSTERVAHDLREAVGHSGLGQAVNDFADSWSVKRERMTKALDGLWERLKAIIDAMDAVDASLGAALQADSTGGGDTQTSPAQEPTKATQPLESGRHRAGPAGEPRSHGGGGLPGMDPSAGAVATDSESADSGQPGSAQPVASSTGGHVTDGSGPSGFEPSWDVDREFPGLIAGSSAAAALLLVHQLFRRQPQDVPGTDRHGPGVDPRTQLLRDLDQLRAEMASRPSSEGTGPARESLLEFLRGGSGAHVEDLPEDLTVMDDGVPNTDGSSGPDDPGSRSPALPADYQAPPASGMPATGGGSEPEGPDGAEPRPLPSPTGPGTQGPELPSPVTAQHGGQPGLANAQDPSESSDTHGVRSAGAAGLGMMGMSAAASSAGSTSSSGSQTAPGPREPRRDDKDRDRERTQS